MNQAVTSTNEAPGGSSGAPDGSKTGFGGKTINKVPLMAALGAGLVVLLLLFWIGAGRQAKVVPGGAGDASHKESALDQVNKTFGTSTSGTVAAATTAARLTDPQQASSAGGPVAGQPGAATAPAPAAAPQMTPAQSAYASAVMARNQQLTEIRAARINTYLTSLKAPPQAAFTAAASTTQVSQGTSDTLTNEEKRAALGNLIAQQQAQGVTPTPQARAEYARLTGMNDNPARSSGATTDYAAFDRKGSRWTNASVLEAPPSAYVVQAGFVIPGVMISGINSTLAGQITAQVAQNVYDTPRGQFIMIPQGSRLVGSYSSNVSYGQGRILIAWQRIIFPDGKTLNIGAMPGSDSAGYSGFKDQVNNHYLRTFGSALMLSLIGAGAEVGQPQTSTTVGTTSINQALSASLAQQLSQTAQQLIQKNLSIAPTLTIRPGYRFNVVVTQDLVFSKPYKGFDY